MVMDVPGKANYPRISDLKEPYSSASAVELSSPIGEEKVEKARKACEGGSHL
jgi:hypothetical protein